MNTNQQTHTSNTTNGQDRFVELTRGSAVPIAGRVYRNYNFKPLSENMWDVETAKEYAEVSKELISLLSQNRVVGISAQWEKRKLDKKDFLGRWTPPVFVEDGKMQILKQELKAGKWGKQLWADYMWYEQRKTKTIFLRIDTFMRYYFREIYVVQKRIEMPLLDRMTICGFEGLGSAVTIYPHSEIEYQADDKETVHDYYQSEDFVAYISCDFVSADITVELNEKYISYQQMIDLIEPLFEKRGIKIKDKTDPYANYPPDYVVHNHYPCAGYEFID